MKRRSVLKFSMHKKCLRSLLKMQNESSAPGKSELISLEESLGILILNKAPTLPIPPVTLMQVGHDLTLTILQLRVCNYIPGAMLGVQGCKNEWDRGQNAMMAMVPVYPCSYELAPFVCPLRGKGAEEVPIPLDCRQWKSGSELISLAWHRRSKMTWPLLAFFHISCCSPHSTGLHTLGSLNLSYFPQISLLLSLSFMFSSNCHHPHTTFSDNPT